MSYENKGTTTATVVVTSGSPDRSGNFVIGAADPAVVIEAAWTYLTGFGGGTLVTKGAGETWVLETQIGSQGTNVTWISDWGLEFYQEDNFTEDLDLISIDHEFTTLIGLNVNGNKTNQPEYPTNWPTTWNESDLIGVNADHFRGERLYLHHGVHHGLSFNNGCDEGEVTGSLFSYDAWNGITVKTNSDNHRITANYFEHMGDVGVAVYGNYVVIASNTFKDIDQTDGSQGATGQWCVGFEGGTDNRVEGNVMENARLAVALEGAHWAVTDNTIANMSVYGVHVNEGDGLIDGNSITGIPQFVAAIWPLGIQIAEIGTINNVNISNNVLDGDSGYLGVRIGDSDHTAGDEISLHGNTYDGTPAYCVFVRRDTARLRIRDENMLDGTRGIYIDGANANVADLLIAGCFIFSMSTAGIDIQNCDDVLVTGTMLRDCNIGLDISNANAVQVAVDGNDFGGSTTGVSAAGVGSVVYGGNRNSVWAWIENAIPA